jgi:hypothetical protein
VVINCKVNTCKFFELERVRSGAWHLKHITHKTFGRISSEQVLQAVDMAVTMRSFIEYIFLKAFVGVQAEVLSNKLVITIGIPAG